MINLLRVDTQNIPPKLWVTEHHILDNEKNRSDYVGVPECYKKLYLLDLNKTLAEHCIWDYKNGIYYPEQDIYSNKLANAIMLDDAVTIIITARGKEYKDQTVHNMMLQLPAFKVAGFACKKQKFQKVEVFKKTFAQRLLDMGIDENDIFGIESNSNTRKAYKSIGIQSKTREGFLNGR